jgi:CheY-like chemotaxis protein
MNNYLIGLLVGLGLCLLAAGLGYRAHQRAQAKQRAAKRKMAAAAAARSESQRVAAERAALEQLQRQAAAQRAARVEAARLAAEEAARVKAARLAAEEAERAAAQEDERAQAAQLAAAEEVERAEAAARAEAALAQAARSSRASTAKRKKPDQTLVMVADDSKIVRVKTGRLLSQHQYRVSYAEDGLDAAKQLQASIPDVVITDVEMPGMDGFELTRRVRQNPQTAHVPVIMITAADDKHREDAQRAGVSVLLGKPYQEEELIDHIRSAMNYGETEAGALV